MYEFAAEGEEAYYRQLKAAADPEIWPELLSSLLKGMDKYWRARQLYISILIEEGMTAELLAYCKTRNYEIETLYPYLVEEYPEEVKAVFTAYIVNLSLQLPTGKSTGRPAGKSRFTGKHSVQKLQQNGLRN